MSEPRNNSNVYKYILGAVFWLLTLYITWTQASSRIDSKVQEAFSQIDVKVEKAFEVRGEVNTVRTDLLEKRLARVEMKLDQILDRLPRR